MGSESGRTPGAVTGVMLELVGIVLVALGLCLVVFGVWLLAGVAWSSLTAGAGVGVGGVALVGAAAAKESRSER